MGTCQSLFELLRTESKYVERSSTREFRTCRFGGICGFGSEIWVKLTSLAIDSTEGKSMFSDHAAEKMWLAESGFEESWEEIPPVFVFDCAV
ncbi:hypothetical protein N7470_006025 [Penicillium chermesinum]|nr:hypothetical protein N7470_006025 [Penicillium chermesinum]